MMNNKVKILCPSGEIYEICAAEFCKYSLLVTGESLEVIQCDDGKSDLIILGNDADNEYTAKKILMGEFDGFKLRYGTDDFCIRSAEIEGRKHLFIGGGRARSLLYAVYAYFEKVCGCRWFWDGDRINKQDSLPLRNINIEESPHFQYRGLRYFAHRGLHRFQAEQWGWEDWKHEIDWMLKKRLNLFMLRIGNDDIFQKAFPEFVKYPDDKSIEENREGYNDRTTAWPLLYRGQLRKRILAYAFARDLMHPEDCGTMTHWYTPTPMDFLIHEKPDFFLQSTEGYNEESTLVWDIRHKRNMDNYIKLTETHINCYGKGELFHTIGFAERMFSDNREENLRMKLYVYRKIASYIRHKYPNAPLLLASWDLWYKFTPEEVRALLNEMDPAHTILLDYTADTALENNFTKWDVVGKFPYIFGIFQAYCSNSGPLGRLDIIEKRLRIASNDSFCKGMVFWPELSHGDSYMISYFTENAWNPLENDLTSFTEKFCFDRYGQESAVMQSVWTRFAPFVPLITWDNHQTELFCNVMRLITWVEKEDSRIISDEYASSEQMHFLSNDGAYILNLLGEIETDDMFVLRDLYDIARVLIGRYIHVGLHEIWVDMLRWKKGGTKPEHVLTLMDECLQLMEYMEIILAQHDDYSLRITYEKLFNEAPVNPSFEQTLKENATCEYNRTYVYEHVKYLYLPEMKLVKEWIKESLESDFCLPSSKFIEEAERIRNIYFKISLQTVERESCNLKSVLSEAASVILRMFQ